MLFKEKYLTTIESEALNEVKFNRSGRPSQQKWSNVDINADWSIFERDARQLLVNLGATYINLGEFKFDLSEYDHPTHKSSQIDAIGYIEHHTKKFLLIVECKHSSLGGKGNSAIKGAFNKIEMQRDLIKRRIKKIFLDSDIVPIWILATRGHKNISVENQKKFSKKKVIHLADQELDYFEDCFNISKNSYFAFNQFLGMYKPSKLYDELKVGALQTHTDSNREKFAYTFTATAEELMPLCLVSHRKGEGTFVSEDIEDDDDEFLESIIDNQENQKKELNRSQNYQRVLTNRRINEISKYLETDRKPFSNNLLISFRGKNRQWKWTKRQRLGQGRTGELIIEGRPGQFHVIDGQHRLFGYSGTQDKHIREQPLIVTAFKDLNQLDEARIFIDVNENQKKVDVSLKMEVLYLLGESVKGKQQVENLATYIILQLRENPNSPFHKNPVAIPQPESRGILPTPQLKHGLMNGNLLARQNDFKKGFLNFKDDFKKSGEFASNLLIWFFSGIRESIEPYWKAKRKDEPNFALQTHFIVGLIYLLERIIDVETKGKDISAKRIKDLIDPYLKHLCNSLSELDERQRELLFGWSKDGIPLKRGTGSYPLARRFLIEELLLKKFPGLLYDTDPDIESHDSNLAEEKLDYLYNEGSVQNIVDAYELVFFENFHEYLVVLFGEHYWTGLVQSEFPDVHRAGSKNEEQKKAQVKAIGRRRNLSGKELALQVDQGSYKDKKIWWVDWAQVRELLEGMFANKDLLIEARIESAAVGIAIADEIKKTFFIQMPSKTNSPQSAKEGLSWIPFIEGLGNPAAHKRKEKIITPIEEEEFNEIKERVIKGVIQNMRATIEEVEQLTSDYDAIDVNDIET